MIEIDRNLLARACEVLGPFVSRERRKQAIPILGHYLLRVSNGRLFMSVSNIDAMATMVVGPVGDLFDSEQVSLTVDSFVLESVVHATPSGSIVKIDTLENGAMLISAPGVTATAFSFSASDFPTLPDVDSIYSSIKVGRRELLLSLALTFPFISHETTRYNLNGVCIVERKGFVHLVATDGHRLSIAGLSARMPKSLPRTTIPVESVRMLRHTLGLVRCDEVRLDIYDRRGTLHVGDVVLTFKSIDGEFPNFERVIPNYEADVCVLTTTTEAIRGALGAIQFPKDSGPVSLVLDRDAAALVYKDTDHGSVSVSIHPAQYNADPQRVGFKPDYLRDVLGSISGPLEIRTRPGDGNGAVVVFLASGYPYWLGLVMSMRL